MIIIIIIISTPPVAKKEDDDDASVDSFSSDSDDEFLTMREDGGNVDREALIRKKLLENFYGKSAIDDGNNDLGGGGGGGGGSGIASSDDDDSDDDLPDGQQKVVSDPSAIEDLDSTHFSAINHTQKHILNEGVHSLLETEEHLACQVRTLDSSMQTLVYENYSRFIDATDAIRSIGINVQANQTNLTKLQTNMQIVSDTSMDVESTVGTLRDQVVEKIRVKRLLQRLDTLLKLPVTLRQQITSGRYRWATKSYLSADSILRKHSTGFESLQRIEIECHDILETLLVDVRRKLLHWSGDSTGLLLEDDDTDDIPNPPTTVSDIFECAGTPVLVIAAQEHSNEGGEADDGSPATTQRFQPGLTIDQCKENSLSASLRLLERVLDAHHLELQESLFDESQPQPKKAFADGGGTTTASKTTRPNLIPTNVLDSILEASTLYSMTCYSKSGGDNNANNVSESLSQFVMMAFNTFLQHVRMELLEQAIQVQPQLVLRNRDSSDQQDDDAQKLAESEEQAYEQVSNSMSILLTSVRQLSSGLALPEVAIDPELASSLVDQTIGLAETMVRRRVDQKFYSLRLSIVEDCLAPFCLNAMQVQESEERALLDVVQMASVSLSDSLQLVDDIIRSTLSVSEEASGSSNADDTSMLKFAVEHSTKRFAKWLAGAMEVLGGCESSDHDTTFEVKFEDDPASAAAEDGDIPKSANVSLDGLSRDDMSEASQEQSDPNHIVEKALSNLMDELPQSGPQKVLLTLAVAEMCRVAERSVMDNISQSIATHGGGSKQRKAKSASLFDGDADQAERTTSTSHRFRLAASRVLGLYAITRGDDAGALLCTNLPALSVNNAEEEPVGPREVAWQVLEIIKVTSLDCADLFGGSKRAGPVPDTLEDEYQSLTISRASQKSGLAFDVERMFSEKVVIYPHPSDIFDFQRNAVVTLVFKVALKALVENARLIKFSVEGFRQLMVDIEFIKHLMPHYVKDEFLSDGSNARTALLGLLTDAVTAAAERCVGAVVKDDEVNPARAVVRSYIAAHRGTIKKITIDSD